MQVDLARFAEVTSSSATVGHAEMISALAGGNPRFFNVAGGDNRSPIHSSVIQAGRGFFGKDTVLMPYPTVKGQPDLLAALVEFHERTTGLVLPDGGEADVDKALAHKKRYCVVGPGGKRIVELTLKAISRICPGSSIVVFKPYWPTFMSRARDLGLKVIVLDSIDAFEQLPEEEAANISLVVVNNPRNPDGYVYSRLELLKIFGISEQKCPGCFFLADEVYRLNVYPGVQAIPLASIVGLSRCMTVFSASKGCKMAGARGGFGVGPAELIGWIAGEQSDSTGGLALPVQHILVPALSEQGCTVAARQMEQFVNYRDMITAWAGEEPAYEAIEPRGTIYYCLGIRNLIGKTVRGKLIRSAKDFAAAAAEHFNCGVMFNDPSGDPESIRMNLAQVRDEQYLQMGLGYLSELAAGAS